MTATLTERDSTSYVLELWHCVYTSSWMWRPLTAWMTPSAILRTANYNIIRKGSKRPSYQPHLQFMHLDLRLEPVRLNTQVGHGTVCKIRAPLSSILLYTPLS